MMNDLLHERIDLLTTPIAFCAIVQLAGSGSSSGPEFGLPVGHTTKIVNRFIDAIIDRISTIKRIFLLRPPKKTGPLHTKEEPFPSKEDWRPILLHGLVHRDWAHFVQNAVMYAQSLAHMRFPTPFATQRNGGYIPLGRGLFLGSLMCSGAFFSALAMDFSARLDKKKVERNYSSGVGAEGGGVDVIGWLFGAGHEAAVQRRTLMIGASGSVFATVGYNAGFNPRPETLLPAVILVANDVIAELTRPKGELFQVADVAHGGHLGGFMWGLSLGLMLRQMEQNNWQRRWNSNNDNHQHRPGGGGTVGRAWYDRQFIPAFVGNFLRGPRPQAAAAVQHQQPINNAESDEALAAMQESVASMRAQLSNAATARRDNRR